MAMRGEGSIQGGRHSSTKQQRDAAAKAFSGQAPKKKGRRGMKNESLIREAIQELLDQGVSSDLIGALIGLVIDATQPPRLVIPPEISRLSITEQQIWRKREFGWHRCNVTARRDEQP